MNDILSFIPQQYQKWILIATVLIPYITRAGHALMAGGGIVGAFKAILYGTNAPQGTATKADINQAIAEAIKPTDAPQQAK